MSIIKEKKREYDKAYRKANREKLKVQKKAWRKANPIKVRIMKKHYYETNKEKEKARWKTYRETHSEEIKAQRKAHYQTNKININAQHKTYREGNREYFRKYIKTYYYANLEKFRRAWRKRRAIKYKTQTEYINEKEIYLRDGWICQICKKRVDKRLKYPNPMSASLDHLIPLSEGGTHTYNNVQLAHLVCNIAKGNRVLPQGEQIRIF